MGNGHVANIQYSTILKKVVALEPMDLEVGEGNFQGVPLSEHYGVIKVDRRDASPIFFIPKGNLNYCKEGMPRTGSEYIELNRMLERTIYNVN